MVFIHYVIYSLTRLESSPHVNRVGLIYWQVKKVFFIPMAILKIQKMLSYFSTHYLSLASNKNHLNDAHKRKAGAILIGWDRHHIGTILKALLKIRILARNRWSQISTVLIQMELFIYWVPRYFYRFLYQVSAVKSVI